MSIHRKGMNMANTMAEMVAAVKKYAEDHYNEDGWDSIVECYDNSDIAREVGNATTIEEAIAKVGKGCKIWDEHRQDVIAEIF